MQLRNRHATCGLLRVASTRTPGSRGAQRLPAVIGARALLLAVVGGIGACDTVHQTPRASAVIGWSELRGADWYMAWCDSAGQRLGTLTPAGRLGVWELEGDLSLGRAVLDTRGEDYVVRTFAWIGTQLAYWRVDGIHDYVEWERRPPPQAADYIDANSHLVVWTPDTGETRALANTRAKHIVPGRMGRAFAVINYAGHCKRRVTAYGIADLAATDEFVVDLAPAYLDSFWPVSLDEGARVIYAVTEVQGQKRRVPPGQEPPWQALIAVALDGTIQSLTDEGASRLWGWGYMSPLPLYGVGALGQLNVVPVDGGVACTLAPGRRASWRLAVVEAKGIIEEISLGRDWQLGPPELQTEGRRIRTVAVTPDCKRLILQAADHQQGAAAAASLVWTWEPLSRRALEIATLPPITGVFGWVRDEYLLVQTQGSVRTSERTTSGASDYQLLHVPREG